MERRYHLYQDGTSEELLLEELGEGRFRIQDGETSHVYELREIREGLALLVRDDGRVLEIPYYTDRHTVHMLCGEEQLAYEVLDETQAVLRAWRKSEVTGDGTVSVSMAGRVVQVLVAPGDEVEVGQGVVVVEAMKMENELKAGAAGVVKAVHVAPGDVVEPGKVLVEIEVAAE